METVTTTPADDVPEALPEDPPMAPVAKNPSQYKLLAKLEGEGEFRDMGDVEALNADHALKQLVEGNASVEEAVREGRVELVAVNRKFWVSRKPSFTPPQLKL